MQLAYNMAPENVQAFMLGRRLVHSSATNGVHDENPTSNPPLSTIQNLAGPNFINHTCNSCHQRNSRALPPPESGSLDKWVFKVGDANGNPDANIGAVLQPAGNGEGNVTLGGYNESGGLRVPFFHFSNGAPAHFSPRISPALVGMGLLEAIPESAISAIADPSDTNGDGISGRIHVVLEVNGPARLGRFGWKAGQPNVRQQVAAALRNDMGVTTSVFQTHDCGAAQAGCGGSSVELSDEHLDHLTAYISLLGVQPQGNYPARGKDVFAGMGCASCHAPTFTTSEFAHFAELRGQTIHPYTDLLLHDMGPGLADTLVEGDAAPSEWRTAPLWGLGKTAGTAGGEAYLHDGRARTLDEAIRWHGGEAEASKGAYLAASQADRDALLAFLRSL
jgi:CxxC motif-containing protein (DUF1111 family)